VLVSSRRVIQKVVDYWRTPVGKRIVRAVALVGSLGSFLLIVWLYRPMIADTLAHGDYVWLGLAGPLYLAAMAFAIVGWHRICMFLGISRGMRNDASYYTLSTIAGRLPGGIWGLVARVHFYRSSTVDARVAAAAWVVEQALVLFVGIICVAAWFVIRGVDQGDVQGLMIGVGVLGTISIVSIVLPWARRMITGRLVSRLGRYRVAGLAMPSNRHMIAWTAVYSAVWCLGGLLLFVTLRVFSAISIEALPSIEIAWIGSRTLTLIITILPSGLGLTEAALALLLTSVVPLPVAATAAVLIRLVTTGGEFTVAAFFLIVEKFQRDPGSSRTPSSAGRASVENRRD
jgi:hypothetical protein